MTETNIPQHPQSPPIEMPVEYEPTAAQVTRAAALRRFNRLYFFAPLILGAVLLLALFILMIWQALFTAEGTRAETRLFYSAIADIVVILVTLPAALACFILPAAAVGLLVYDRPRERTRIQSLQRLLWRVDSKLEQVKDKTREIAPKIAAPVIRFHAIGAYLGTFLRKVKRILFG